MIDLAAHFRKEGQKSSRRIILRCAVMLCFFAIAATSVCRAAESDTWHSRLSNWFQGIIPSSIPVVGSPLQLPFEGKPEQGQAFGNYLGIYLGIPYNGHHSGEDWSIGQGQVLAMADGEVSKVVPVNTGRKLGMIIILKHSSPKTFYSAYTHVIPASGLKAGDPVERGKPIARLDFSVELPPHLHWEVRNTWDERSPWWKGSNAYGYYSKDGLATSGFINPSEFVSTYAGVQGIPKRIETAMEEKMDRMIKEMFDGILDQFMRFFRALWRDFSGAR